MQIIRWEVGPLLPMPSMLVGVRAKCKLDGDLCEKKLHKIHSNEKEKASEKTVSIF